MSLPSRLSAADGQDCRSYAPTPPPCPLYVRGRPFAACPLVAETRDGNRSAGSLRRPARPATAGCDPLHCREREDGIDALGSESAGDDLSAAHALMVKSTGGGPHAGATPSPAVLRNASARSNDLSRLRSRMAAMLAVGMHTAPATTSLCASTCSPQPTATAPYAIAPLIATLVPHPPFPRRLRSLLP